MEDIQCEICFSTYQSGTIVPRLINCGHTFCTNCIVQQINSSHDCPECRQQLEKDNAEDYPINYALLRLVDTIKNPANIKTDLEKKLNTLKKKFDATEMELTLNLSEISTALNSIEKQLVAEDFDIVQTNYTITNLNEKLTKISCNSYHENIRNSVTLKLENYNSNDSVTLKLENYNSNEDFLQDIYNRIINLEELYAIATIKKEVKYARVSRDGNKLLTHAFGHSPQRKDIKTIWFDDIKSCVNSNCGAFLDIACNEKGKRKIIFIKIVHSIVGVLFLYYCTGEKEPVFKGQSFSGGGFDQLWGHCIMMTNGNIFQNHLNFTNNTNYTQYGTGDVVCAVKSNGFISIYELVRNVRVRHAIGRIQNQNDIMSKISYGENNEIKDCGIFIEF